MSEVFLYNLTLRRPTHSPKSVVGNFTGSKKKQDILCANGTNIQLFRPDPETGSLSTVCQQDLWAEISLIDLLRLPGSQLDVLVITSDSGKLSILKFDTKTSKFYPLVQEPYTKTGFRRISPGSFLAVDPSGKSLLISAVEKNKICYPFALSEPLAVSAPLECNNNGLITLHLAALDTGFDNPLFVAIEIDSSPFEDPNLKFDVFETPLMLNFYEFDQALNHLGKKKQMSYTIPPSASSIIPLPGKEFLICCKGFLIYDYKLDDDDEVEDSRRINVVDLPRRVVDGSKNDIQDILCFSVYKLKKNDYFILIQTTNGDLFKVTIKKDKETPLKLARVTYFDSIAPCHLINLLRSGFLFANTSIGDKFLYQFESLGDDIDDLTEYLKNISENSLPKYEALSESTNFKPREPVNLSIASTTTSLAPIFGSKLLSNQRNDRKTLAIFSTNIRFLSHGIPTNSFVSAPLPITPVSVFTSKLSNEDINDEYLVISSTSQTLVLSIGEVVEEVEDSHFVSNQPTIAVQQIGKSSVVQVYPHGVRHVKRIKRVRNEDEEYIDIVETDWYPPAGIFITSATSNQSQLVLALSNREICYFEVSQDDDTLLEYQDRAEMLVPITSIAIPPRNNGKFCVVGCSDETITIILLTRENCLSTITLQALSSTANSLLVLESQGKTFVHIGMKNGLHVRSTIEEYSGKLSDTRTRYLGSKPVQLSSLGDENVLAVSTRPWICSGSGSQFKLTPLAGTSVSAGSSFYSEDIGGEGIVGISGDELEIFVPENEVQDFIVETSEVEGQPRKFVEDNGDIYFIGHNGTQDSLFKYSTESKETIHTFSFPEMVTSLAIVEFEKYSGNKHLIVGCRANSNLNTPDCLYTFNLNSMELLYKTECDLPPTSMCSFAGKLVVGMQNFVRLYDIGLKQLLRKALYELSYFKTITQSIPLQNDRRHILLVSDISLLVVALKYDLELNKFFAIADDTIKRHVTSIQALDNQSMAGGDKFGNFFMLRIPDSTFNDAYISKGSETSYLNGLSLRFNSICEFHVGDIITSINKGSLNVDGVELLIYTGLQGTIGIMSPVASKSEVEFFVKLELELRAYFDYNFDDFNSGENGYNLVGRDHLKFRSYYNPCKNVIDGDLIERFVELNYGAKVKVAGKFDRTPSEIEKRIEDMRNRAAF